MTDFHLPGYELLFTTEKSCGHGGLMIYVHNQFSAKPIDINENIHEWERQCIELSHKSRSSKKYVICNIYYIPPNQIADDLNIFIREFSNTLSFISNRQHSAYICGDFNIDLLQMYTNHYYNDFFETAVSIGFLPKITLPTRIGEAGYRSSLIDSIFTNAIDAIKQTISGTLLTYITDHKAIFTSVNDIFPEKLKSSKVIPIFISGEVSCISNYRPISLLPSLPKIVEYVILDQLTDYPIKNNILCSKQFGFRSGYSTEFAALRLIYRMICHLDAGIISLNIYILISLKHLIP